MRATNDPYFNWLCILVGINKGIPGRNYIELAMTLHNNEFRPSLMMDSNRVSDGLQLRVEFMNEHGPWGSSTNRGPCSFLEFLVSLSKRMSFLMHGEGNSGRTEYYFWKLIDNLGLRKVTDEKWYHMNGEFFVEDAVWRINNRQYQPDGSGGLFPLRRANRDQRSVEIWYQMNAWLMENSNIGDL